MPMKDHQWPIHATFGELVAGMQEIVGVHDLKDGAIRDIAGLLKELFDVYAWRRCRDDQRSLHAMSRELVVGMCEIIDAHGLGDEVVWQLAEVLGDYLENTLAPCRPRQASARELFDDLFAIYEGDRDEKRPPCRELLDDLGRRRKKQKLRRRGFHPAMAELLVRLDRYGSDYEKAQSKAAPAAD
jgi:hypothetical protein